MKLHKLIKPELDKIIKNANFTDEELKIVMMLSKGKNALEISQKMMICERTVYRRMVSIREKIERVVKYDESND